MKEDAISTVEAMLQGIEKARSESGKDGEQVVAEVKSSSGRGPARGSANQNKSD